MLGKERDELKKEKLRYLSTYLPKQFLEVLIRC